MGPVHVVGRDTEMIVGEAGQSLQHRVDLGLARDKGGKGLIVGGAVGGDHRRCSLLVFGFDAPIRADVGSHINSNTLFLNDSLSRQLIMR